MNTDVNHAALERLVRHELDLKTPTTPEEAVDFLTGRMGAYDTSGVVIRRTVDAYFTAAKTVN